MSKSFRRRSTLPTTILILATACADPVTGIQGAGPEPSSMAVQQGAGTVDISGDWSFHEDATFLLFHFGSQATKAFRCSSDGTYTFVQVGNTFTGTFGQVGVCTAADGTSFPNDFSGAPVTGGTIQGMHVRFDAAGCLANGALRGPELSVMGGGIHCGGGGTFGTYRAAWSAWR